MARPNIALIIADDVPRNMLGAYGAGHGLSPHLDKLARDGIVFDRAYTTAPLCTPSRFALLTGRYASNASSIIAHRPWNLVGFNTFLTGTEPTIAHRLQRAGYATCFVGKYHLGFPLPKTQSRGRARWGGSGRGLSYTDIVGVVRTYGGFEDIPAVWGGNKQTAQSPHNPEWMAAMAAQFVQRATSAADKKPFFLYFAGTVPHSPFALPASFEVNVTRTPAGPVAFDASWQSRRQAVLRRLVDAALVCKDYRQCHGRGGKPLPEGGVEGATYEGAQHRTTSIGYKRPLALTDPWLNGDWLYNEPNFEQVSDTHACFPPIGAPLTAAHPRFPHPLQGRLARLFVAGLAWLDDSVGTVLDALRVSGVEGNTIVAYTADHGASFMGKGHVYEAGVRVPLLVRWPDKIPKGSVSNRPVALIDLAPTFLAAANAADEATSLHGHSILSTWVGAGASADAATDAPPIFIEIGYARAVVRGPWKLVVVNDALDRCHPPADGSCKNLHGELIDRCALQSWCHVACPPPYTTWHALLTTYPSPVLAHVHIAGISATSPRMAIWATGSLVHAT